METEGLLRQRTICVCIYHNAQYSQNLPSVQNPGAARDESSARSGPLASND